MVEYFFKNCLIIFFAGIFLNVSSSAAFAQCGLPGTPPCPPSKTPSPKNPAKAPTKSEPKAAPKPSVKKPNVRPKPEKPAVKTETSSSNNTESKPENTISESGGGMYSPDQIHLLPLQRKGLKVSANDIYNQQEGGGLSEAVISLSVGCTGAFVSPDGLILTNHHCAFDALVSASSSNNNYGEKGYAANSRADELPALNYSINILKRVENVTARVLAGTEGLNGTARDEAIRTRMSALEKEEQARSSPGTTVRVQSLNNGFFYYLYATEQIKDIRVVYAPPRSIGDFGGETDSFRWIRHTGDFAFLRAYVAPGGSLGAAYSPGNVPFKPEKFLTISLNGIQENDPVFALGYPGGTTRYRESQSINYSETVNFPFLKDYLAAQKNALVRIGENDREKLVRLQSEIYNVSNAAKAYEGGLAALRRDGTTAKRITQESKFAAWVNADSARAAKYGNLLSDISRVSDTYYRTAQRDRLLRIFPNGSVTPVMKQIFDAMRAVQQGQTLSSQKRAEIQEAYNNREPSLEVEMIKFFFQKAADLPPDQKFSAIESAFMRYQGNARRNAEESIAKSIAEDDFKTSEAIFSLYSQSSENMRQKYPIIYSILSDLAAEQTEITVRTNRFNSEINQLRLLYIQGMSEMTKQLPYPDGNFTQRFTYGNIRGYSPYAGVTYKAFTTLKGVIEKDTGREPFNVPQKLKELQNSRDFGRYESDDTVPVNFLATTDIIGGNSGSPVMNANGEQIGIVFDSNYEGLGNDIFFNPDYGRTIAVDIRYVLFVTEKFGNAGWILNEMKINGAAPAKGRAAGNRG